MSGIEPILDEDIAAYVDLLRGRSEGNSLCDEQADPSKPSDLGDTIVKKCEVPHPLRRTSSTSATHWLPRHCQRQPKRPRQS